MRKLSIVFAAIAFIFMISIPVFAHGGSVDEHGGHVNWETGEYHYHHGHPAHLHDGGICPYEWEDNTDTTNHGSTTSTKDYNYNYTDRDKYVPDYHPTPAPTATPKYYSKGQYSNPIKDYNAASSKQNSSIFSIVCTIIFIAIFIFWKKHEKEEAEYQKSLIAKKQMEDEKEKYTKLYGGKHILEIINAPSTAFIDDNGMPHQSVKNDDIFVIYLSPKQPRVFHRHKGCGKNLQKANYINLWRYKREITPCKKCNPIIPDTSWYYEYLKIKQIKEKYDIE